MGGRQSTSGTSENLPSQPISLFKLVDYRLTLGMVQFTEENGPFPEP